MEDFNLGSILSQEELDSLFEKEEKKKEENKETQETTDVEVDIDTLLQESVGSEEEEENQGGEDTIPEKIGSSPSKSNLYSSIANALKEDGIFEYLDDSSEITDAESFARAIRNEVVSQLDYRQKRIDEALSLGMHPTDIQKYEQTLGYLDSIKDEAISDESEKGEALRKQLIYNDFINRGYSKERANREVKKSFDAGTDIEDAKEALKSNKDYYQEAYDNIIAEYKREEEEEVKERNKAAEQLKKDMLESENVFGNIEVDKAIRRKAFEAISKPVYKDPKTGELFTAIQKYEMENRMDFLKNIGFLYALTNGFKSMDKLIKIKAKKEVKKGLSELERVINNTARTSDGNLKFVSSVNDDEESYYGKGWKLDL